MAEQYHISGTVAAEETRLGLAGLRVEAWDKDPAGHGLLGVGVTDERGRFRIGVPKSRFRDVDPERLPNVSFKVFRRRTLLAETEGARPHNLRDENRETTLALAEEPVASDRISGIQMLNAVEFVRKSDFRGVWRETRDKTGAAGTLLGDALRSWASKAEWTPLKPSAVRTRDVVNVDVATAQKNLEQQRVTVNEVKPYTPEANRESLKTLTGLPLRLKPGERVDLYEENGIVKYYAVVREAPAGLPSPGEVRGLMETARIELGRLRTATEEASGRLDRQEETVRGMDAAVNEMKTGLATVKRESAEKDRQIAELRATTQQTSTVLAQEQETARSTTAAVNEMKTELAAVRRESAEKDRLIAELRATTQQTSTVLAQEQETARNTAAAVNEMKTELATVKRESAEKDRQIAKLNDDLRALRISHERLAERVGPR